MVILRVTVIIAMEEDMLSHAYAEIDGVEGCGDSQEKVRMWIARTRFKKYVSSSFYHLSMPSCGDHDCSG
jgi:hypothetical protein